MTNEYTSLADLKVFNCHALVNNKTGKLITETAFIWKHCALYFSTNILAASCSNLLSKLQLDQCIENMGTSLHVHLWPHVALGVQHFVLQTRTGVQTYLIQIYSLKVLCNALFWQVLWGFYCMLILDQIDLIVFLAFWPNLCVHLYFLVACAGPIHRARNCQTVMSKNWW